jgi:hypothetical protein
MDRRRELLKLLSDTEQLIAEAGDEMARTPNAQRKRKCRRLRGELCDARVRILKALDKASK